MKLIDNVKDISKPTIAGLFAAARGAAAELGARRADISVDFGPSDDPTETFDDFDGMKCSLTFTVKPANGT